MSVTPLTKSIPTYHYEPQEDITTYELARIIPYLLQAAKQSQFPFTGVMPEHFHGVYRQMAPELQRHFRAFI